MRISFVKGEAPAMAISSRTAHRWRHSLLENKESLFLHVWGPACQGVLERNGDRGGGSKDPACCGQQAFPSRSALSFPRGSLSAFLNQS